MLRRDATSQPRQPPSGAHDPLDAAHHPQAGDSRPISTALPGWGGWSGRPVSVRRLRGSSGASLVTECQPMRETGRNSRSLWACVEPQREAIRKQPQPIPDTCHAEGRGSSPIIRFTKAPLSGVFVSDAGAEEGLYKAKLKRMMAESRV